MKLTGNVKLYLIALAVCTVGYFYSHPSDAALTNAGNVSSAQSAAAARLPADATRINQFQFYCPQLEGVSFGDDGVLHVGPDDYILQFGHLNTLTFQGAKGIALLRGEAQPDGGLFLDKSVLTVGGKDYECVII